MLFTYNIIEIVFHKERKKIIFIKSCMYPVQESKTGMNYAESQRRLNQVAAVAGKAVGICLNVKGGDPGA
jgi:hypothetical protein